MHAPTSRESGSRRQQRRDVPFSGRGGQREGLRLDPGSPRREAGASGTGLDRGPRHRRLDAPGTRRARWRRCRTHDAFRRPRRRASARSASPAGEFTVERWDSRDGLPPHNHGDALAQTPTCYLWAAPWEGMVRWNGIEFTVFDRGNTPSCAATACVRSRSVAMAGYGSHRGPDCCAFAADVGNVCARHRFPLRRDHRIARGHAVRVDRGEELGVARMDAAAWRVFDRRRGPRPHHGLHHRRRS